MFQIRKRIFPSSNRLIATLAIVILFIACDNFFEYSVYGADVKSDYRNKTEKNLELIDEIKLESENFKFAVFTDTHIFYTNFRSVIDDINNRDDISFVIFGGDLAEQGLLKEYELFYNIVEKLNKPYITVIGNHDYSSNGGKIYKEMFGDFNYSFTLNNNKFVLFDNIVWESNKDPDFNWLLSELSNNESYNQVFVIAHIPPFGDQFNEEMEEKYQSLLQKNNVSLSIHGHTHKFLYEKYYQNDVYYLTVPAPKDTITYCTVSVKNKAFDIELVAL